MSQDSDGGVVVDFGNGSTQHLSGRDAAKLQVLSNNGLEALIATRPFDEVYAVGSKKHRSNSWLHSN